MFANIFGRNPPAPAAPAAEPPVLHLRGAGPPGPTDAAALPPADLAGASVALSALGEFEAVAAGDADVPFVTMASVRGGVLAAGATVSANEFVAVVDVSGSMSGEKIELAKQALAFVIEKGLDGADEITDEGAMIKGGGAALTREKIVASVSKQFVCIADGSKLVASLGTFPLPVEVIPMARAAVMRQLAALGGQPRLRTKPGSDEPFITDNGGEIVDVVGLQIADPVALETQINGIVGVIAVGLFARQGANVCLLGMAEGVKTLTF